MIVGIMKLDQVGEVKMSFRELPAGVITTGAAAGLVSTWSVMSNTPEKTNAWFYYN